MTTTGLVRRPVGLSRMGFLAASASTPAAAAWAAWARPISHASRVATEFRAMFWALKGATLTPRLASQRHTPATSMLLPQSDEVPAINNPPFNGTSSAPVHADDPPTVTARVKLGRRKRGDIDAPEGVDRRVQCQDDCGPDHTGVREGSD